MKINNKIFGYVKDYFGVPIENAHILIDNKGRGVSNKNGYFEITVQQADLNKNITVTYQQKKHQVGKVIIGKALNFEINTIEEIDEVILTAKKPQRMPNNEQKITKGKKRMVFGGLAILSSLVYLLLSKKTPVKVEM